MSPRFFFFYFFKMNMALKMKEKSRRCCKVSWFAIPFPSHHPLLFLTHLGIFKYRVNPVPKEKSRTLQKMFSEIKKSL